MPSSLTETSILLSGEKATDVTISFWPLNVTNKLLFYIFHSLIVLLAEAKYLPSGEKATDKIV